MEINRNDEHKEEGGKIRARERMKKNKQTEKRENMKQQEEWSEEIKPSLGLGKMTGEDNEQ